MLTLQFDSLWLLAILLVSIRLGALFVVAPVFGGIPVPGPYRVLLVVGLAFALVSALDLRAVALPRSSPELIGAALSELALGGLLAFGVFAAFAAFMIAGRIIDLQMGFGVANLIDPITHAQAPLLGTALQLFGVVVFVTLDGHHELLRGLAESFARIPPGAAISDLQFGAVVVQFGTMFTLGVALAAPVMFTLLLIDLGLSLMARSMPQLNVFLLSIPIKILAGLTVLTLSLRFLAPVMHNVFESIFTYWRELLS